MEKDKILAALIRREGSLVRLLHEGMINDMYPRDLVLKTLNDLENDLEQIAKEVENFRS